MSVRRFVFSALVGLALPIAMPAAQANAHAPDFARIVADPQRSDADRALDEGRKPAEVLAFSGIAAGQTVADYGAGGGYYSALLAKAVGPKGRVIALAIPKYYKAEGWDKLRAANANIALVVSDNLALAPRSVDAIFSHLEFHDLFLPGHDAASVLANWFSAIRPGGHVIVADHVGLAGDTSAIADSVHRINPAAARAALAAAGFVEESSSDVLQRSDDDHTLMVFDPQMRGKTDRFLLRFRRP